MVMHQDFFIHNRRRLRQKTGDSVCVFTAYSAIQKSGDLAASFLQEPNFWWLTGIEEPDWQLVMDGVKSWLVAPSVDETHRVFDGGLTTQQAKRISGVDEVISRDEAEELLIRLAKQHKTAYGLGKDPRTKYYNFVLNPAPEKLYRKLRKTFTEVKDCRLQLAKLRAVKQPEEIKAIRRAVDVTVEAFQRIRPELKNFKYEYEVEAEFSYDFQRRGTRGHAYDPIVAGGLNACTLHYNNNDQALKNGELLLIDIGARVDGYAADITRTYAIGQPTKRQQEVQAAVEKAHHKIIALLKPDLRIEAYLKSVDQIMKATLRDLGLLAADNNYRVYFPHAISHGLGIDVHDSLGQPDVFLPGMVLTVEPGIYIPEEGIGVRIEDDILITKTGHENLSAALPTSL